MPLNPNLQARLDQSRSQNGELSPYHKWIFVPLEGLAQKPEIVQATELIHGILNPNLDINIEGLDLLPITNTQIQRFTFSLQAEKLPTYSPGEFWSWKNRAVDLRKLFDPTKTFASEGAYRKKHYPFKRNVSINANNPTPYITEQQALAGEVETPNPTILKEILAEPFVWTKDSIFKGEDRQRALILITTQPGTSYIDEIMAQVEKDAQSRSEREQTELDAFQREIARRHFADKQNLYNLQNARNRLAGQ